MDKALKAATANEESPLGKKILNQLLKHTQLQDTFGVIMLALVNNEPKVMNCLLYTSRCV